MPSSWATASGTSARSGPRCLPRPAHEHALTAGGAFRSRNARSRERNPERGQAPPRMPVHRCAISRHRTEARTAASSNFACRTDSGMGGTAPRTGHRTISVTSARGHSQGMLVRSGHQSAYVRSRPVRIYRTMMFNVGTSCWFVAAECQCPVGGVRSRAAEPGQSSDVRWGTRGRTRVVPVGIFLVATVGTVQLSACTHPSPPTT